MAHRRHGGQPDHTSDLLHDDQRLKPHHGSHRANDDPRCNVHRAANDDDNLGAKPHVDRHGGGAVQAHRAAAQQAPEPEQADQDPEALTELTQGRGTLSDMDCVFCSIAAGEIPADLVLDEPDFVAFLDRRPVFKGHVLLVPRTSRRHPARPARGSHAGLTDTSRRLAAAAVAGLGAQGTFVAMNNVVSQSVPHLHVHVVPRTKGDGLRGFFWPRTKYSSEEESAAYAARLAAALAPRRGRLRRSATAYARCGTLRPRRVAEIVCTLTLRVPIMALALSLGE